MDMHRGDSWIGLMSGTSLDGVDGVLASFDRGGVQVHAHAHTEFDAALRAELLALNSPGPDELHRAALAANALARVYAQVVAALRAQTPGEAVRAVGAHGQTVRHRPGQFDGTGYTLQLNAPALLAELTGLPVVADLRSRDLAAGGQAAPLVPAFHRACFGRADEPLAVANIGGIANLTLIEAAGSVRGFDCGPGNALMDGWCQRHLGQSYDAAGRWAAAGRLLPALLAAALADPYFALAPPKSTGRDDFHAAWLDALVATHAPVAEPRDVQATLCELTARAIARDLQRHLPEANRLLVCGGGALNDELMRCLAVALPGVAVVSTAVAGLPPLQVEAAAFAWLARAHLRGEPGNLPGVTGAAGPRVLGALYPA
ncbi:MAG TPA: anhydro-N-acetylmuramic acid kinase [Methylibium sp.]|nr:anhydro-N-acetylmuramic acid kinase [Methylibium sp.]